MKCEFCGAENPDGATFCKACGKRIDNKTQCPSCHKTVPADSGFCIYCGADISAKQAAAPASAPAAKPKVDIILKWISVACAYAVAVISLICIFFIGVSASGYLPGGQQISGEITFTYFLSDAMSDVDMFEQLLKTYEMDTYVVDIYSVPAATGLITFLALIIIQAVFCSLTAANSTKALMGKKYKSPAIYALGAFLTNAMAVAFMAYYSSDLSYDLNSASLASLTLGSILTAATLGCDFARRGKPSTDKAAITKYSTLSFSVIVFAVIAGLCSMASYSAKFVSTESMASSGKLSLRSLILSVAYSFAGSSRSSSLDNIAAYGCTAMALNSAIIIISLCTLWKYFSRFFTGNGKGILPLNIVLAVLGVLNLALCVMTFNEAKTALTQAGALSISASCDAPIGVLIVCCVGLAVEVANILNAKRLAAAPAEQNSAAAQTPVATETPAEQAPVTAETPVLAETSAADETPDGESEADFAAQKENAAADIDKSE